MAIILSRHGQSWVKIQRQPFGDGPRDCYTQKVVSKGRAVPRRPSPFPQAGDGRNVTRGALGCPRGSLPMPRPDSSVVERGPEKAGVGGSIPSLATILSTTYKSVSPRF